MPFPRDVRTPLRDPERPAPCPHGPIMPPFAGGSLVADLVPSVGRVLPLLLPLLLPGAAFVVGHRTRVDVRSVVSNGDRIHRQLGIEPLSRSEHLQVGAVLPERDPERKLSVRRIQVAE